MPLTVSGRGGMLFKRRTTSNSESGHVLTTSESHDVRNASPSCIGINEPGALEDDGGGDAEGGWGNAMTSWV